MMSTESAMTAPDELAWPFLFVLDADRHPTGWAMLNGPITTHAQQHQFAALRRAGVRLVGSSSHLTFPRPEADDPLDYPSLCEAWCHCFREPDAFLPHGVPRSLLPLSDFTDGHGVARAAGTRQPALGRFDFVYVGAVEDWKREAKGWAVAARWVPLLCRDLQLRALVIGTPDDAFPVTPAVTFRPHLPWATLLAHLASARFLLVPNHMDPSPRLLAEALSLDVPVLVHREILGGWHYVNRFTGVFSDRDRDVTAAARACLEGSFAPAAWFRANHGPHVAGMRLRRLLRRLDPHLRGRGPLTLAAECEPRNPRP